MNDEDFMYHAPAYNDTLTRGSNLAVISSAMASRLVHENRSRAVHPGGRDENVGEHSHMLAKVVYALASELYPDLDTGKAVMLAVLHDDVEAYVGDTPTHSITEEERQAKHKREQSGLQQLVAEHYDALPHYVADVSAYELEETPEARFVRVVDKIMVILIHLADDGATLRKYWTFDSLVENVVETANRLHEKYPEFADIINIRTELGMYLARKYLLRTTR